ncbi:class II fructose-bisphosphate aldolase [[Clostridium] hylemonae]|uniref:Ketose-bisphosphate aldolase n=1 Tax=[Clostridium] hylemonae DSM 15053 TaxID=553973 RepID=C0C6H4_9FIRM|nr:class II fructose-bisphosphate aldolase [[Clostridium] hylemonae]EEG72309.1 ketose-bisphosphate aldolase [[Clostridium] hylemonae DSM 15053]QEK16858.1 Fructose-bisphosphate aldolase [[Clostridium] hylemonae DSM 15053]
MLVTMKEILDRANEGNYAVPAPVVQTELNARTAIKCAEEMNSPVILLVPLIFDYDVDLFGRYLKALAEASKVPVAVNHDHGSDFESAVACIRAGFSSIMVDRSELPFEENAAQVKELVKVAHAAGVSVEAELGHVGNASNYEADRDAALTEPELAKRFIEETGIDCLAVAIGTAHGAYDKGQIPYLDYDRLEEIKKVTGNFPLVLHGGSGTGDEGLKKAARMGINKVNIGCELFASAIEAIENADTSGSGAYGFANIIEEGYGSRLKHFITILGSEGMAWKADNTVRRKKVEITENTIL